VMRESVKRRVRNTLSKRGLSLQREIGADFSEATVDTIKTVRPYTMTTVARIEAVCSATEHIVRNKIPGAFVESGVWMGGSSMAAALTLVKNGVADRDLYMFDTFDGMPAPGEEDALIGSDNASLRAWWEAENKRLTKEGDDPWLHAPVDKVRGHMGLTGYDLDHVHLVPGMVEDTVPKNAPDQIAFLRLDTDYYSSTKVELETMFPRLSPGGILIVDDYGFTEGTRKAVDDYFASYPEPVYFHRVDSCARLMIKPGLAA
jgi:O-methyltransferase